MIINWCVQLIANDQLIRLTTKGTTINNPDLYERLNQNSIIHRENT